MALCQLASRSDCLARSSLVPVDSYATWDLETERDDRRATNSIGKSGETSIPWEVTYYSVNAIRVVYKLIMLAI